MSNLNDTIQRVLANAKKRSIVIGYREGDAFKEAPELFKELLTESFKEFSAAIEVDEVMANQFIAGQSYGFNAALQAIEEKKQKYLSNQ